MFWVNVFPAPHEAIVPSILYWRGEEKVKLKKK
jgi:hypothetical protein